MGPLIWIGRGARAAGFAAGWAGFTLLLTLASRLFGWGPGFSDLLPYALAAIGLSAGGHLARLWLGEGAPPSGAGNLARASGNRADRLLRERSTGNRLLGPVKEGRAGLALFFRGTASCNNFLLLSLAYFIGIGLSSLLYRMAGQGRSRGKPGTREPAAGGTAAETYWRDLDLGKRDADAYYRPF